MHYSSSHVLTISDISKVRCLHRAHIMLQTDGKGYRTIHCCRSSAVINVGLIVSGHYSLP